MKTINETRNQIQTVVHQWLAHWQGEEHTEIFTDDVQLFSQQHGTLSGNAVAEQFYQDSQKWQLDIHTSNEFIAGKNDQAAMSLYLFGNADQQSFSGMAVLRLRLENTQWKISEIRLLHSFDRQSSDWSPLRYRRDWQPNDDTIVIISELHSPHALFPDNQFSPEDDETQIAELYARYSWGLDMLDWQVLADVFADDVEIDMPPMGKQQGKHNVHGQLRHFRLAVPAMQMQHIGETLSVNFADSHHADILHGRIISERFQTDKNERLYAAHYNLKARKETDGVWRYTQMAYHTGWFTAHTE